MPVMDEFKAEREAMKNKSFKERLLYFWDYYKWHVIGGAAGLFLLGTLIHDVLTNKDYAFYGAFINTAPLYDAEEFVDAFEAKLPLDFENEEAVLDATYYISENANNDLSVSSAQKMIIYISAGDVDVIATDEGTISNYALNESLFDLRTILTEEQIASYEDYFYYVDMEQIRLKTLDEANSVEPTPVDQIDPRRPDLMTEPIPVAIYVPEDSRVLSYYLFSEGEPVLAVPVTGTNVDWSLMFIDYALETVEE